MYMKVIVFWMVLLVSSQIQAGTLPNGGAGHLPVWTIFKQSSGVKALLYGYRSNQEYRFIDPYSPIYSSSSTSSTGWISYLVKEGRKKTFGVKRASFKENGEPEDLGKLEEIRGEWRYTPVGGKAFSADGYFLTSKGILLVRSSNVFTYLNGRGGKPHVLPDGWNIAWFQKGDIESTRIVTVEKSLNPSLFDYGASTHTIGFYDIDKRRIIGTLDMSFGEGKEAKSFNEKFYLFDSFDGPISVAIEDGYKHVTVRNVRSGKKRIIFERSSGISSLNAEQDVSGNIKVKASLGFSTKRIDDAEGFLNGNP